MFPFVRTLLGLPTTNADPAIAAAGWDVTPVATTIAVIVIVGFCIVAVRWVINRDV